MPLLGPIWVLQLNKMSHTVIISGNDCWNTVHFSCCRKADNELADLTLSGSLFQNGNVRPPTVDKFKTIVHEITVVKSG